MTGPLLRDDGESGWRGIRAPLKAIVFIAAFVVLVLAKGGRLSEREGDWAIVVLCLLFAVHLMHDVRRGRTQIPNSVMSPRYDYVRSADPVGFWVLIALQGGVAIAIAGGAVGGLLGLLKI